MLMTTKMMTVMNFLLGDRPCSWLLFVCFVSKDCIWRTYWVDLCGSTIRLYRVGELILYHSRRHFFFTGTECLKLCLDLQILYVHNGQFEIQFCLPVVSLLVGRKTQEISEKSIKPESTVSLYKHCNADWWILNSSILQVKYLAVNNIVKTYACFIFVGWCNCWLSVCRLKEATTASRL